VNKPFERFVVGQDASGEETVEIETVPRAVLNASDPSLKRGVNERIVRACLRDLYTFWPQSLGKGSSEDFCRAPARRLNAPLNFTVDTSLPHSRE